MQDDYTHKSILIKEHIVHDFTSLNLFQLEKTFDKFKDDKNNRTLSFIAYYNRTVLDKERIRFGEFKQQWAIQGMTRKFYTFFDENFDRLKEEIRKERNIRKFYETYCCTYRREGSFCSKLFHTVLPAEFPPVDNPIKKKFNLQKEEFIDSVLIIKEGYGLFIKENPELIGGIRTILSRKKFAYLRINELSDIRILDMYYWFKENRDKVS
ncbi:MAG: hypothetical protein WC916_04295 [Candidatus Woesearchaeota archaeon]